MRYLPIVAAVGLGMILLAQKGTTAGPNPPPRTVPVTVQNVIPPSRMLTVESIQGNPQNSIVQMPIPLASGQVFVLTSWSTLHQNGSSGLVYLVEGPVFTNQSSRDFLFLPSASPPGQSVHNSFPTGIRFPRDASGNADLWIKRDLAGVFVIVRGYITDDF